MSDDDRSHWDERFSTREPVRIDHVAPPSGFADHVGLFPTTGRALDIACGEGVGSVWLARRGLDVTGFDVSPVALERAWWLAEQAGVDAHCRFRVTDLDDGLPAGPPVDLVCCHLFRNPDLYPAMAARLSPGGLLAVAVLSEVDAESGCYRASEGELATAFEHLEILFHEERDGRAILLARNGDRGG